MCSHGDSPGKSTGVSCHSLLQGIFLTQGSNLGLLHCRQILYHLSHQGRLWFLFLYLFFPFFKFIFNWRIMALQYYVDAIYQHESVISVHMSPPSGTPSHFPPLPTSRLSHNTGFELPASYSKFPLAI